MATYHVQMPDGSEYNIDADSDQQVQEAVTSLGKKSAADSLAFERSDQYPTAAMTDTSANDALMVQGAAGLAKGAAGAGIGALKGVLTDTVVPTLERNAAGQALRSMGASVGQVRQMGPEAARAAGKYGIDNGLVDVFSSEVGREAKLKAMQEATGKTIGDLRSAAGPAPANMAKQVGEELAPKYANGVYSGEQGALGKALEEIPQQGTHADMAKTATKLNDFASKNNLVQPTNAATDVANMLSQKNNAGIVQSLGSDKGQQYVGALEDFSKQKPIGDFMARGEAKEAAGRGSNTAFGSVTGALKDFAGHRMAAKATDFAADTLGGVAKALPTPQSITSQIMKAITTNPQSLGKFAVPLMQAAQSGGTQGIAATHFVLSHQYPEYNQMFMGDKSDESGK